MAKHKQYHTRTSLNRGLVITLRSETCTKRKFTGKTHITVRHDSKGGLKCLTLGQRGVKKTTLMASTHASWNEFHKDRLYLQHIVKFLYHIVEKIHNDVIFSR